MKELELRSKRASQLDALGDGRERLDTGVLDGQQNATDRTHA